VFLFVDDLAGGGDGQEIVAVPAGLDQDEQQVQTQGRDSGEGQLGG
jgi:hypothetical protein